MIDYKAVPHRNPQTKEVKYYPSIVLGHPMLLDELAANIARVSTVSEHDVKAVLSALQEQAIEAMKQGRSVRFGDLGSLRPTLAGKGSDTADEVTEKNITGIRVQYTKSAAINAAFQTNARGISFHKVSAGTGTTSGDSGEEESPDPLG